METTVTYGALQPYCERLVSGAEPWNVSSNLVFVLLGLYAVRRLRRSHGGGAGPPSGSSERDTSPALSRRLTGSASSTTLAALPFAIGAGSAIYHAYPSHATQLADLLPIALFVALAVALALERVLKLARRPRFGILLGWTIATLLCARHPDTLGGSLLYLPTLVVMAALGPLAARLPGARADAAPLLVATAATFTLALVARTADQPLCPLPPTGTHPLWHLLAAAAGAFAVTALMPRVGGMSSDPRR